MSYATTFIKRCQQNFFIFLISDSYRSILPILGINEGGNKNRNSSVSRRPKRQNYQTRI
jgi:hypothetical protein